MECLNHPSHIVHAVQNMEVNTIVGTIIIMGREGTEGEIMGRVTSKIMNTTTNTNYKQSGQAATGKSTDKATLATKDFKYKRPDCLLLGTWDTKSANSEASATVIGPKES